MGHPAPGNRTAYRRAFDQAGFQLVLFDDLSQRAELNWTRSYLAANRALGEVPDRATRWTWRRPRWEYGVTAIDLLTQQYYAVPLAKAAADSGILHDVSFLEERR